MFKKGPIIVSSKNHGFLVKEALNRANLKALLVLEPTAKNTTAAIYLAARLTSPEDQLLIMPSDHFINDPILFSETIEKIQELNECQKWITFGITPHYPSEAYGYINIKEKKHNSLPLYSINKFIEKPFRACASVYR